MTVLNDCWIRRIRAGDARDGVDSYFVYLSTDRGVPGVWGPISATQALLILGVIRGRLLDLSVTEAGAVLQAIATERHATGHLAMACTACDLALWDIKAKQAELPLCELLGKATRTAIPCYASLLGSDIFTPPADDQLRRLSATYWGLKWAARRGNCDSELWTARMTDALRRMRDLGSLRLMLDVFGAWNAPEAETFLTAVASLKLAWVEEPVAARELVAYRWLAARSSTPLAAGEHSYGLADIANLIDCGVRVLQPDAAWCGGLAVFRAMVDMAASSGCTVFPHGGGLLPALHVSTCYPDQVVPAIEFHLTVEPRRQALWRRKYVPIDGYLIAPSEPGLGADVDESLVAQSTEFRNLEWAAS